MADQAIIVSETEKQEIQSAAQGETGLTAAQVSVLSKTLLKNLSAPEMGLVFHQAKQYDLDVFKKEIWGFPGKKGLVTMVSRDGLQKVASRHPAYGGILSAQVYEKDDFQIDLGTGTVKHIPARTGRGNCQGAWAKVIRRGYDPLCVYVTIEEVKQNFWDARQSADMVLVRAEARALRRSDVGTGGLYLEEEIAEAKPEQEAPDTAKIEAEAVKASETVRAKRRAAKVEAQGVVEVPKNDPAGAMEAIVGVGAAPVIIASKEQVAAFVAKCGGEKWAKKHCLRALGNDNLYALTPESIEAIEATLEPRLVDETLEKVAAQEREAGETSKPAALSSIDAQWLRADLSEATRAQRRSPGALNSFCAHVLKRPAAKPDNLTPTEAERVISAIIERNASAPKA